LSFSFIKFLGGFFSVWNVMPSTNFQSILHSLRANFLAQISIISLDLLNLLPLFYTLSNDSVHIEATDD